MNDVRAAAIVGLPTSICNAGKTDVVGPLDRHLAGHYLRPTRSFRPSNEGLMMHIFWRVILGFGALVFGVTASDVAVGLWLSFGAHSGTGRFAPDWDGSIHISGGDGSGQDIQLTVAQFVGGAVVILLVAASLSVACAYFAFRSEKDRGVLNPLRSL